MLAWPATLTYVCDLYGHETYMEVYVTYKPIYVCAYLSIHMQKHI